MRRKMLISRMDPRMDIHKPSDDMKHSTLNLLKIVMLCLGKIDSELPPKKGVMKKAFSETCCHELGELINHWGEVNPVHAYYNGSCTSKDNEDPSWSTSFKTRRTQKTSSALEVLWKTLFLLYLYMIGTL
ncbi:hypothetical protein Tco_0223511 [Tanacetum coccineum]